MRFTDYRGFTHAKSLEAEERQALCLQRVGTSLHSSDPSDSSDPLNSSDSTYLLMKKRRAKLATTLCKEFLILTEFFIKASSGCVSSFDPVGEREQEWKTENDRIEEKETNPHTRATEKEQADVVTASSDSPYSRRNRPCRSCPFSKGEPLYAIER
jgi:hypothetical protein